MILTLHTTPYRPIPPLACSRQYRKISLLVHPDKCKHSKASEAFEIIREAQRILLQDEERTKLLLNMLDIARGEIRKERKREVKRDTTVKVASLLHEQGKEGMAVSLAAGL